MVAVLVLDAHVTTVEVPVISPEPIEDAVCHHQGHHSKYWTLRSFSQCI